MPLNLDALHGATVAENEANSNRYIEAYTVMDCHQLVYFVRYNSTQASLNPAFDVLDCEPHHNIAIAVAAYVACA